MNKEAATLSQQPTANSQQPTANSQQPTANSHNHVLKILICYHKPYTLPPLDDGILLPIHAGKAISDKNLNMQADNEVNGQPCDNISEKNGTYCELTVFYWAWKNLKKLYPEVKHVGFMHYRRFFAFDESKFLNPEIYKTEQEINNYKVNLQKVMSILDSGKSIFPKPYNYKCSSAEYYRSFHVSEDYEIFKDVIRENFPDYFNDFVGYMENNNKLSYGNMFIMSYDEFVKYCEWLFSVLSIAEKRISFQEHDSYQKRVPGFMAERLLSVYVQKHKIKPKYINVYKYIEGNNDATFKKRLAFIARYYTKEIVFRLKMLMK